MPIIKVGLLFIIPVLLIIVLWRRKRPILVGLIISTTLVLQIFAGFFLFRPIRETDPYLSDVLKDVSWVKDPIKVFYIDQHILFSLDVLTKTVKKIFVPVDDFRFSPSGERIDTTYFRTDGEDKIHPEILTFRNFPENSHTVYNLKTEKVEYQASNDFACSNIVGFIDEESFLVGCTYKFKIINFLTKDVEIISVPERTLADDPYLTNNKKVIWHDREDPFKCHEYDIEKKKANEYTISPDIYFCANPSEMTSNLDGAIRWGNDWAWDQQLILTDGKQGMSSCKDGGDVVLCLKPRIGEEKFLVRCKGCETYSQNAFGRNPYYFDPLDWSRDGKFVLFSFNGKIYLYDFETNQAGYLADGEMARFY